MDKATQRAQQVAIDRNRRLHNEAIEREEAAVVDLYLMDIEAYVAERRYVVKCDECKTEIRRTDSMHESACGGRCAACKEAAAMRER